MKLTGSNGYPWEIEVDGADYVFSGPATWFGGQADADSGQDSGETASGLNTIKNPNFFGCALPIDLNRPKNNPCKGSAIVNYAAKFPWYAPVWVTNDAGLMVPGKLIDLGPDAPPEGEGTIDLTQPWFKALNPDNPAALKEGKMHVSVRIPNAVILFALPTPPAADTSSPAPAEDPGLQVTGENFQT